MENQEIAKNTRDSARGVTFNYVQDYMFIQNMHGDYEFGYVSIEQGACGYIALAIQIAYNYNRYGSSWIPNSAHIMTNAAGTISPTEAFTLYLRSIGRDLGYTSSGTVADQLNAIAVEYARRIGKTIGHHSEIIPLFSTVKNHILNNRPAAIFGNLSNDYARDTGSYNHAVVAYGTMSLSSGSNAYVVHYGWPSWGYPSNTPYNPSAILLSTSNTGWLGSDFTLWE